MNTKLFIPKQINVGYQERSDTYTKKLAYIIYWDQKGKLRKEASWNSWRHKPEDTKSSFYDHSLKRRVHSEEKRGDFVKPEVFDNTPTSGFVLNKGVGGARGSWSSNIRNEYIRVYDPRNFEFEISVANLLYILQETSSIKGKGIEGEFIYSWNGTELFLLPVNSQAYKDSVEFTEVVQVKFSARDFKEGRTYVTKSEKRLVYIKACNLVERECYNLKVKRKHVFWDIEKKKFVGHTCAAKILKCENEEYHIDWAEVKQKFSESLHDKNVITLELGDGPLEEGFVEIDGKIFKVYRKYKYNYNYHYPRNKEFRLSEQIEIVKGTLKCSDVKDSELIVGAGRELNVVFDGGVKLDYYLQTYSKNEQIQEKVTKEKELLLN